MDIVEHTVLTEKCKFQSKCVCVCLYLHIAIVDFHF